MSTLYLDAETRSECDIRKAGSEAYLRHPTTQALIWTWAFDDEPVESWDVSLGQPIPEHFTEALGDPCVTKVAFNAPFDRGIITHVMGLRSPLELWKCALVLAYSMAFKGTLDEVLAQIGFRKGKDPEGKKLINRFSTPNPKEWTRQGKWSDHTTHPEEWDRFVRYGIQDTEVLRQLWTWCDSYAPMSEEHWGQWRMDQRINQRGVPVDTLLCQRAQELQVHERSNVAAKLRLVTDLPNPLSNAQMRGWLEAQGYPAPSLAKDNIPLLNLPPNLGKLMDLYLLGNAKAAAKYARFLNMSCEDHRVRGMFQFNGAGRTGRWAGRGVQVHNLKRGPRFDEQPELIRKGAAELIEAVYGSLMDTLAESVRGAICATEGHSLVVSDLSAIESRLVAWLTGCGSMMQVFADGRDTYKDFAVPLFEVPYEEVTKEQRTFAKPAVLGGAYMLGGPGLLAYAEGMGVELERKEAFRHIRVFREKYPEIPSFWEWIAGAIETVMATGQPVQGYRLTIGLVGDFLRIWLPSGRGIWYYKPRMEERKIPYEDEEGRRHVMTKLCFTYMGINQHTTKWERVAAHAGGITENIIQALARDVLTFQMGLAEQANLPMIGHVHDEIIVEELDFDVEVTRLLLQTIMSASPPWAPDLVLGAESYISWRYKK